MSQRVIALLVGAGFGAALVAARLNEYDTIHRMLLLREFDVFLLMGSAIGTAAPLLWWLRRSHWNTPVGERLRVEREPVRQRHVLGGLLFGAGWAITGACPGPALAMAATGAVMGLPVIAGIMAGAALRDTSTAANPAEELARSGC